MSTWHWTEFLLQMKKTVPDDLCVLTTICWDLRRQVKFCSTVSLCGLWDLDSATYWATGKKLAFADKENKACVTLATPMKHPVKEDINEKLNSALSQVPSWQDEVHPLLHPCSAPHSGEPSIWEEAAWWVEWVCRVGDRYAGHSGAEEGSNKSPPITTDSPCGNLKKSLKRRWEIRAKTKIS